MNKEATIKAVSGMEKRKFKANFVDCRELIYLDVNRDLAI